MLNCLGKVLIFLGFFLGVFVANLAFAAKTENPCTSGENYMLSLVNRPTAADSACVVPDKKMLAELGYQYQNLQGGGTGQNFPQLVTRFGLPSNTEFGVAVPNYVLNSVSPRAGFGPTTVGLKHEVFFNSKLVLTLEDLLTPPSGSDNFGVAGFGNNFNGIFSYSLSSTWAVTGMLGHLTLTEPIADGGGRFSALLGDLVVQYTKDKLSIYGEAFGLSKTAPDQSVGINADGGLIYLVRKNVSVDIEYGCRVTGHLGNFNTYIGAGFAVLM